MPYNSIIDRTDAGALIPEEVSSELFQLLPTKSVCMQMMRTVPMSRKQQRMPVLSVLPIAYFVNGDTGLKATTEQNWTNKYLNAEELAVIVPIPESVLDDTDFDIWGEIKPRLVEAMAKAIDAAILFGTNKPSTWGTAIATAATSAGMTYDRGSVGSQDVGQDINLLMALVEAQGYAINGFAAMPAFKAALRGLRSTTGELLFQPTMQAGTPGMLYGEKIVYCDNGGWATATGHLICGDWSQAIVGLRQDITYKILDQAVIQDSNGDILFNLPQQDMVALRATMRVAFETPNPVTALQATEGSRYPFGILAP